MIMQEKSAAGTVGIDRTDTGDCFGFGLPRRRSSRISVLFPSRLKSSPHLSTHQYARVVHQMVGDLQLLRSRNSWKHSQVRRKAWIQLVLSNSERHQLKEGKRFSFQEPVGMIAATTSTRVKKGKWPEGQKRKLELELPAHAANRLRR